MALMPDPTAAAATPMGGGQTLNDRARREALVMALMRQGQPNAAASSRSPMGSIAGGVGQGVDAFTRALMLQRMFGGMGGAQFSIPKALGFIGGMGAGPKLPVG